MREQRKADRTDLQHRKQMQQTRLAETTTREVENRKQARTL